MTKRQRTTKPIQYTIRTDSQSMAKLALWGIITGAVFIAAVSLLLLPPLQAMPGNEQNWQTMKNATGTYNVQYVPTTTQVLTALGNVMVGILASFGALFMAFIYRPRAVQWKVSRNKQMASVIDIAMKEEGIE